MADTPPPTASSADGPVKVAAAPLLRIQALRFGYAGGETLLDIDRLDLQPGEHLFMRGPSGSGKSTLLSLAAGVLAAGPGMVSLAGRDWAGMGPARRDAWRAEQVGYVFQQFNLLAYLSVLDNVLLPCRFCPPRRQRAGGRAARDGAAELLQRMQLPPALWTRPAAELSVGQQQRVAAARALIGRPALVIADEPTSALDEALREDFMALLLGSCRDAGSALLFVSHDARLAAHFTRQADLSALNRAGARQPRAEPTA
ncbi:MAG: ABC transporter ATP-binding protein [Aquabacterium sp.]